MNSKPESERLITPKRIESDSPDAALRPQMLVEFIGQRPLCENLSVFIAAARQREEALDHILFAGPPGLGKTTLAHIISRELGVGFKATSGPVLTKGGDLAAILTNLQPRDVLFIDEIHRLNPVVEEILYPAMEDFQLDLVIGEGPAARTVRIELPRFTLVAATTRSGLLATPLRDRFGIPLRLNLYEPEELAAVVKRAALLLHTSITEDGAFEIARRARGTPRVAGRLLRRVRDFAQVAGAKHIDAAIADKALLKLDVDSIGLDPMDRRYLRLLIEKYAGGPVGIETIAAALAEERDVVEEVVEPFLLQQGLVQRTPRGRMISAAGYKVLGIPQPKSGANTTNPFDLFDTFEGDV